MKITHLGSTPYAFCTLPQSAEPDIAHVKHADGTLVPCQRRAFDDRLVELIFPTFAGQTSYELVDGPSVRYTRCKPGRFAQGWINQAPTFILDRGTGPEEIDCDWSDEDFSGRADAVRNGLYCVTRRFSGTYVHGYVTVWHRSSVVRVEMQFHNQEVGSGDLMFKSLAIESEGRSVHPTWEEYDATAGGVLIAARTDGKLHALERKGQREFRFTIWNDEGAEELAFSRYTDFATCDAFAQGGYQIQGAALPTLPTATALGQMLASDNDALNAAILSGKMIGANVPSPAPTGGRVDFKSMWSVEYGGATSGTFRRQYEGVIAWASSNSGAFLELLTRSMMTRNRCSTGIRKGGRVVNMETYLDALGNPKGGWKLGVDQRFETKAGKKDWQDGPFGFSTAPAQIDPTLVGLVPPELASKLSTYTGSWAPIDDQHSDRRFMPDVAKAWLAGDPLSIENLRMDAELARMSLVSRNFLGRCHGQALGQGGEWDRSDAHLMHLAAQAYPFLNDRKQLWWAAMFEAYATALCDAQMVNGLFQRRVKKENTDPNNNAYAPLGSGAHAIAKITEEALLANSLFAITKTDTLSPELHTRTLQALVNHCADGLWKFAWLEGATGAAPYDYVAVAPIAGGAPYSTCPAHYNNDREEIGAEIGHALSVRDFVHADVATEIDACTLFYCGKAQTWQAALSWLEHQSNYTLAHEMLYDQVPLWSTVQGLVNP